MRIQEMKSGFSHLKKKMGIERPENYFAMHTLRDVMIDPETGTESPLELVCELNDPQWSVVSFDKLEAGGLTYSQASALTDELNSLGVAGLCVVTDAAAFRILG
jgi:hypothetical protein